MTLLSRHVTDISGTVAGQGHYPGALLNVTGMQSDDIPSKSMPSDLDL